MVDNLLVGVMYLLIGAGSSSSSSDRHITFIEDSNINILNPDRGFYDANYNLNSEKDYNMFKYAKEDGYFMVYAPINLDSYIQTETLPNELIGIIDKNFRDAIEEGVKLILRIKYRSDSEDDDPAKEIALGHLEQLRPLLQEHKNIISVVQAGTIGAWGEWHSFTGDYADTNTEYKTDRKNIVSKLIEIFPEKYIQLRTPMHKELLYGSSHEYGDEGSDAMITPEIAFTDDEEAKIGHHNDCFLASETDMGTYPSDNIAFWQEYVVNDAKYSPMGGETCKDDNEFTNCINALDELKRFQYSYINEAYHPDVLQRWKDEGCYDEINENIGYRLVAKELVIKEEANSLSLSLSIENKGYAAPYIKSDVRYVLKNSTDSYTFEQNIDLRTFYSTEVQELQSTISLNSVENGEYCLYLQIGETYSAIRFSNSNLWEESSQTNKLACGIEVE